MGNKRIALLGVVTILILLTIGAIIRAVRTGEGLNAETALPVFTIIGALVAYVASSGDEPPARNDEEELGGLFEEDF